VIGKESNEGSWRRTETDETSTDRRRRKLCEVDGADASDETDGESNDDSSCVDQANVMRSSDLKDAADVEEDRGAKERPFATDVLHERVLEGAAEKTGESRRVSSRSLLAALKKRRGEDAHRRWHRRKRQPLYMVKRKGRIESVFAFFSYFPFHSNEFDIFAPPDVDASGEERDARKTETMFAAENSPKSAWKPGSLMAVPTKEAQ
jgi:hypothetical protein